MTGFMLWMSGNGVRARLVPTIDGARTPEVSVTAV